MRLLNSNLLLTASLAAAFLVSGCASIEPAEQAPAEALSAEARECSAWMASLDRAVEAAGVRDASAYRIPGFAYLRADRFTASFGAAAGRDAKAFEAWTGRLRELDLVARGYELANLPAALLGSVRVADARAGAQRAAQCGALLAREDLAAPARRTALLARAVVPDDYAAWVRDTGVYAVASVPFAAGVEGWHKEAEEMFRKAASGEGDAAKLRRYDPAGAPVSAAQVRAILARAPKDALGVPRFSAQDADALFRAYAPQYEIETTGPHDHFGPLAWKAAPAPEVDTSRPVVYRRLAYTRYGERSLVQLVYTLWFPERPADRFFDILAGKLDGLVIRVTLDEDGAPLVVDTIHPCGCYHMFFPTALLQPVPAPNPREEWAFMPSSLPRLEPAQRVVVRTATRSHYVVNVRPAQAPAALTYAFANEDELRALPTPDGRTRSVFGPDALVAGTERPERALFWPMGIASPGTMRQWGRHPTAFLGRRHFDDADLIEKRFARGAPAPAKP